MGKHEAPAREPVIGREMTADEIINRANRIRLAAAEDELRQLHEANEALQRALQQANAELRQLRKSRIVQLYDLKELDEERRDYEIGHMDGLLEAAFLAVYGKETP